MEAVHVPDASWRWWRPVATEMMMMKLRLRRDRCQANAFAEVRPTNAVAERFVESAGVVVFIVMGISCVTALLKRPHRFHSDGHDCALSRPPPNTGDWSTRVRPNLLDDGISENLVSRAHSDASSCCRRPGANSGLLSRPLELDRRQEHHGSCQAIAPPFGRRCVSSRPERSICCGMRRPTLSKKSKSWWQVGWPRQNPRCAYQRIAGERKGLGIVVRATPSKRSCEQLGPAGTRTGSSWRDFSPAQANRIISTSPTVAAVVRH
jgi:hypothetical protein